MQYTRGIEQIGIKEAVKASIDYVSKKSDNTCFTIDIDVVDPAFAPGTGTPELGGITSTQFLDTMTILGECNDINAIDLVEVFSPYDNQSQTMGMLAAAGLVRFIEQRII